ncbi:MAG: TerD family protein [Frankia sp.]
MTQVLGKGANAALPSATVTVEIVSGTSLDIAALLVTASGKVRSDDDFIFYNQPSGPGVKLVPPSRLECQLDGVPADIDKVVLTGSLDGSGPLTFAGVAGLAVIVRDGSGAEVARFDPTGLSTETALVLAEIYRRQGAWKVRAVGQGYAAGLAGIATDFGITVDDSPPAAQPVAAPTPTQPVAPAPTRPAAAATPARAPGPAGAPTINLDKGRVSLKKGQSVSLVKTGAPPLTRVRMALGWDPTQRGRNIDLDASCILYDDHGKDTDKVWFMSKKGARGAVRHSGDNLTGDGSGDDESIFVDLAALPATVAALVFTVNSFQGQKFTEVRNAYCRLIDDTSNAELARFDLSESKPQTGLVMCKVARAATGWVMTAIGEFHDGKTVRAMVGPAKRYL